MPKSNPVPLGSGTLTADQLLTKLVATRLGVEQFGVHSVYDAVGTIDIPPFGTFRVTVDRPQ